MRVSIHQLKQDIVDAKTRQDQAKADATRIENDMIEFKNNKGGKLAELQNSVADLKRKVAKQSQEMKAMQKEFQTAQLETEQTGGDLAAAQEQLEEADTALKAQQEEVTQLKREQAKVKDLHDIALAAHWF
jgi:structural maintenance of chromosome 2